MKLRNKIRVIEKLRLNDEKLEEQMYRANLVAMAWFARRVLLKKPKARNIEANVLLIVRPKRCKGRCDVKSHLYISVRKLYMGQLTSIRVTAIERNPLQGTITEGRLSIDTLRILAERTDLLPPRCQRVLKLSFEERKTDTEIARRMRITRYAVKKQMTLAVGIIMQEVDTAGRDKDRL